MRTFRLRSMLIVGALAVIAFVLPSASASALVPESSQITTPSGTVYMFIDTTVENGGTITVAGTTNLSGIELRCYFGPGLNEYHSVTPYKEPITVSGGAFSVTVERRNLGQGRCVLRAVPAEYTGAAEGSSFEGPTMVASFFSVIGNEFQANADSLNSAFEFAPAGGYALESSLYSAATHNARIGFFGEADLSPFQENVAKQSRILIDGANAYPPTGPHEIEAILSNEAKTTVEVKGALPATVNKSFNESTHSIKVVEEAPLVKCAGSDEFPPTYAGKGCEAVVSTGVTLTRVWETSEENHLATLTETWRSTDGAAHSMGVLSYNELNSAETEAGAYLFPGSSGFAETHSGENVTLPAGPGAIYYKSSVSTPEGGDGVNPQLAIVYDTAPSAAIAIHRGSSEPGGNSFEVPYRLAIPAGGSRTLRSAYAQGFNLAEVRSLAEKAQASFAPSVSITAPASTSTPTVTVSGTASDTGVLSSLGVNGRAVAVAANGTWSANVPLSVGANTITATATDEAGLSKSSAIVVTYTPPPPPSVSQLRTVSGANGKVTLSLACKGPAGSVCHVQILLSSVEKTRHGRVIAISAKARTRSKKVTVGARSLTIKAGDKVTVTVALNATGRKLLAHFHRLPVHLSATLVGAKPSVVIAQNLTIKPARKKKHRRR